ncbi:MAG: M15 family metallopeptidase [Chromatiales bacterium]|nr:M15 family metallopeptidase [Chromatiales bacterium]
MNRPFYPLTLLLLLLPPSQGNAEDRNCSYETYQWSTVERRAVNRHTVTHPYSELRRDEIDPVTGCSVCREDQVTINISGIEPFQVCHVVAGSVESALRDIIERGIPVDEVVGYRVGRTRGEVDENGLRTRFSNHSFGVAVDINPQHNGLYDRCITFGPHCRLIRGGEWRPEIAPASHAADGTVVKRFKREGFQWGGEIRGRQKDFMHFSPTGY